MEWKGEVKGGRGAGRAGAGAGFQYSICHAALDGGQVFWVRKVYRVPTLALISFWDGEEK